MVATTTRCSGWRLDSRDFGRKESWTLAVGLSKTGIPWEREKCPCGKRLGMARYNYYTSDKLAPDEVDD